MPVVLNHIPSNEWEQQKAENVLSSIHSISSYFPLGRNMSKYIMFIYSRKSESDLLFWDTLEHVYDDSILQ